MGEVPFKGKKYEEVIVKNLRCNINYSSIEEQYSEQCVSLLKKMLEKDPRVRLSAQECLNHPCLLSLKPTNAGKETIADCTTTVGNYSQSFFSSAAAQEDAASLAEE